MRSHWSGHRVPVATAVLLLVGLLGWVHLQRQNTLRTAQDEMIRNARGLGDGLSILAEQIGLDTPAQRIRFREAMREHLMLDGPIFWVEVRDEDDALAQVGDVNEDALVLEHPLGPPCDPPPRGRPAPWRWHSSATVCGIFHARIGVDPGFPPQVRAAANQRALQVLVPGALAIGALLMAWMRTLRSRALSDALAAERRQRAILSDLNLAAAGLAHETRNPLGIIHGLADRMAADPRATPQLQTAAEQIIDEADRAAERLSDFMNFARIPDPVVGTVDLDALLERIGCVLSPEFEERSGALTWDGAAIRVQADAAMLEQLIVNLLLNSLEAAGEGQTRVIAELTGARATLSVCDDGPGIPEALRSEIFKPYVSAKPTGHGLGLAIVKRIVDQHGWRITITHPERGGCQMQVHDMTIAESNA